MPYADMALYRAAVMMPWDLNLAHESQLVMRALLWLLLKSIILKIRTSQWEPNLRYTYGENPILS